jgi:hypothetical protein
MKILAERFRLVLLPVVLALALAPALAEAQEFPPPDRERLEVFAKAMVELADVRDEGFARLASTHGEGKEQVREEFDHAVEELLRAHGLSPEEFEELTFLVSADEAHREMYREILEGGSTARPD